jgi:hypothetical protein
MMTAPRHRGNGAAAGAGVVHRRGVGLPDAAGHDAVVLESAVLR